MALHAGGGDVPGRDRGPGVGMGEDEVAAVAARTGSGDRQALLEKTFTMNTHGVVLEDVFLVDLVGLGDLGAFPVALATKHRDVHDGDWRSFV